MRPLQLVDPINLIPVRTYLIQEKRPEYRHLRSKDTFVRNVLLDKPYQDTFHKCYWLSEKSNNS